MTMRPPTRSGNRSSASEMSNDTRGEGQEGIVPRAEAGHAGQPVQPAHQCRVRNQHPLGAAGRSRGEDQIRGLGRHGRAGSAARHVVHVEFVRRPRVLPDDRAGAGVADQFGLPGRGGRDVQRQERGAGPGDGEDGDQAGQRRGRLDGDDVARSVGSGEPVGGRLDQAGQLTVGGVLFTLDGDPVRVGPGVRGYPIPRPVIG